jgi:hypothetical protein
LAARNAVPILCIPKPNKPKDKPELRTVVGLRARNKNTIKINAPLPNIEGMLQRVASHPYRSLMDQKDAYEQVRVIPEHVYRTAMTTPDGTIESLVMQQGDCNAPGTYQALINHIFANHIRVFMDVYLDNIIIYLDTLEEHVKHCKIVFDTLKEQLLYLSPGKMQLLPQKLKILGRVINEKGIRMDYDKVDDILNWKTLTSKELVQGFLGSVGFLADDITQVRIPMGVLHSLTGANAIFRWHEMHQRAFDQIKEYTAKFHHHHHRMPLDYKDDAPPINLITDACTTGIASIVSQGEDWKTAKVTAFFSVKLNSAQQNYPVHELEMFAGVKTMKRHRDILYGTEFRWFTDYKALIHFLDQKNLSGQQACWIEAIFNFNFEIIYIEGSQNILSDALSQIYSNDAPGTVRNPFKYPLHDEDHPLEGMAIHDITMPVLVGLEAAAVTTRSKTGAKAVWTPKPKQVYQRRPKTLNTPDDTYQIPLSVLSELTEGMKGGKGSITTPNTFNTSRETENANSVKLLEERTTTHRFEPLPEKETHDRVINQQTAVPL